MTKFHEIDRLNSDEIPQFQNKILNQQLDYLTRHSVFYQRVFREQKIAIEKIKTIDDLKEIPLTDKEDLQKFHAEFICVEPGQIIDYSTTSGTLGKPVVIPQTEEDLNRLSYNEARSLMFTGGTKHDIYQLSTTINKQFMAGLAYFLGARRLGAGIIRVGSGAIPLQWQNILSLRPTALIVVPSFLVKMIEYAEEMGIDFNNTTVKKAICIGEPIRNQNFELNALGSKIVQNWDIKLYSTYASTEMATAFTECEAGNGGHHQPDLIIAEIVDEMGNPVGDGETGELVVTPIGLEAFPLLRFKTGDICKKHVERCSCGRHTFRLGPIIGRKNQMIKYKGTTLYPPAIFDILNGFEWINSYHISLETDEVGCDKVIININESGKQNLEVLKKDFASKLRVTPEIRLLSTQELNKLNFKEGHRKPINFSDLRKLKI